MKHTHNVAKMGGLTLKSQDCITIEAVIRVICMLLAITCKESSKLSHVIHHIGDTRKGEWRLLAVLQLDWFLIFEYPLSSSPVMINFRVTHGTRYLSILDVVVCWYCVCLSIWSYLMVIGPQTLMRIHLNEFHILRKLSKSIHFLADLVCVCTCYNLRRINMKWLEHFTVLSLIKNSKAHTLINISKSCLSLVHCINVLSCVPTGKVFSK